MGDYSTAVLTMKRGGFPAVGVKFGVVESEIDLTAINSGTLADNDLLQAISFPVGSYVAAAGMEVTEAVVGAAQLVLDLGFSTGAADMFVDGSDAGSPFDIGTSGSQKTVGTYAQQADPITTTLVGKNGFVVSTADTLDVKVQAITGASATVTAGKVRVWALVADVDGLAG
jgi:hypothetical protein